MFFDSFRVFYVVGNQAYKIKLSTKKKIHDIFYVLPLEQEIIKRRQVNRLLELKL